MNTISKQEIMEALGRDKTTITDELVTTLNMIILDEPEVGDLIGENFLTYGRVLNSGKYSITKYFTAIKYCSFKMMNMTNIEAYRHTYPDRYERLRERYIDMEGYTQEDFEKKVSSYVYAVSSSKLVTTILSQIQIPTKILNMGVLQEAINVEASLMRSARSETVREKAANTLIQYLGGDEENKIQIDIGYRKDDIIDQYEAAMLRMAEEQLGQIRKGADVKQIANAQILEAEVE